MVILVTGAAGFIGSHVCEHYIRHGHYVVGIDNLDNYYPERYKKLNLAGLLKNKNFRFHKIDIRDRCSMNLIFSANKIDAVIHLAAKAGVSQSIDYISDYYDVNVNGTISVLEEMKLNNVKKMIFASSSSVYGNNPIVPFSESDHTDYPISPYASTKRSGELLCYVFNYMYGFDITCLRFFTVFGPRQRPDLAIHKFTRLIDEGKSIPYYGDGLTSRDYTYVLDIVNGISYSLDNIGGYNIYNLGRSKTITLKSLVKTIELALGKKADLCQLPLRKEDVKITFSNISKAESEIGYNPKFSFQDGINEFIKWYLQTKTILQE